VSVINAENTGAWQALANDLSATRPSVGMRVRVETGKRKGRTGVVLVHMVSRYEDPYRYASEAQAHLREMAGRFGFVVRIRPDDGHCAGGGGPDFWSNADRVTVIGGAR
jgi:hypothetical protein